MTAVDQVISRASESVGMLPSDAEADIIGSPTTENFVAIGHEFLRLLIEVGGLRPEARILDIGCGVGRIAIPLTRYLDGGGTTELNRSNSWLTCATRA